MAIIDAHTHLAPASPLFNEWAQKTGADHSLEGLLREMDENDVESAIVIGRWPRRPARSSPSATG